MAITDKALKVQLSRQARDARHWLFIDKLQAMERAIGFYDPMSPEAYKNRRAELIEFFDALNTRLHLAESK